MVRAVWIARVELIRMLRERSNLFFVFIFPLLLVVLIGAQFGGSFDTSVGVVAPAGDPDADALISSVDAVDGIATVEVADAETLRDEVTRGVLSAGIVVPDDYGHRLRTASPMTVEFVGRPDATSGSLEALVSSVLAGEAVAGDAAAIVAARSDADPEELRGLALDLAEEIPGVEVSSEELGVDELGVEFAGLGQFDLGASSQLFLFTFLTALTGGAALIQTRQYGVAKRMLSTSTPMLAIIAGQAGGRLLVALTQAVYIVVATVLLFQVDWGDPLATGVIVLLFCLVSAGAGLLIGATFRNDSQAAGAAVGLGLAFAALGGSMAPLEIFPETMRSVARVTPHAWANEAMAEIVRRDGTLVDVLPEASALALMAIVLIALAAALLQRTLTR